MGFNSGFKGLKRRQRYKKVKILNTQSTLSQIWIWPNKDLRPGIRQTFSGIWKVMKALLLHKKVTAEEREVKLDALFRRKAWPFTCRPRMCRSLEVFLIYISSLTFLSHLAMPDMVQITWMLNYGPISFSDNGMGYPRPASSCSCTADNQWGLCHSKRLHHL